MSGHYLKTIFRPLHRCSTWPELGWALLAFALLYYYLSNYQRSPPAHRISVITSGNANYPRNPTIFGSDVRVIGGDMDIAVKNLIYEENFRGDANASADGDKTEGGGPKLVGGYPRPEIRFLDKSRDSLPGESPQTVRILSWTAKYDEEVDWFTKEDVSKCEMPLGVTCEYTSDRALYNYSDAVLFRLRLIPQYGTPTYRFASHKWVYVEFESAVYSGRPWFEAYKNVFNMTNTHNPNSTIAQPRPTVYKKLTPPKRNVNYAKDKTKKVAWFVSNCFTQSRRETYAQELAKYIPIDIYGKCGNLTCLKAQNECERSLLQYKFYLSFENSLCTDYFTEKFWRTVKKPIIGITLGAADYARYVPKGMYIDIRDFRSPRELANYLLRLDSNDDEYNAIIHTKEQYEINFSNSEKHICDVCKAVHSRLGKVDILPNAKDFYSQQNNCMTPKEFYKKSASGLKVPAKFFAH